MWTKQRIIDDLDELRISRGDSVLVHASMRAVGPVEGGADTVVEALLEAVGPDGTIVAPVFQAANHVRPDWNDPLAIASAVCPFDLSAICVEEVGILAERIRLHPDARRSAHPSLSFAAMGSNAAFITENAPFHFPLGTNGPLARLHQLNGKVLLIGVTHAVNSSLHLAEVWANVPYTQRRAHVRTAEETWEEMEGSAECSAGFTKIEPILRQARILRSGYIGNAPVAIHADAVRGQHGPRDAPRAARLPSL
jgi:Aminoglycoside N3''-acetyltransferase